MIKIKVSRQSGTEAEESAEIIHINHDMTCCELIESMVIPAIFCLGYTKETIYDAMWSVSAQAQENDKEE